MYINIYTHIHKNKLDFFPQKMRIVALNIVVTCKTLIIRYKNARDAALRGSFDCKPRSVM